MTPVASVEEEGLAGERRRDDEAAPKVDVIGLKTITSYLKSYLTTTSSGCGALNETAIDLKIEQAMDLVKNHLLFAVREEIYLLKKQIVKLSERNRQLEEENEFLRNAAVTEDVPVIQQQPFHS